MNILIAMDSLKGSLSSDEANHAIAKGLLHTDSTLHIQTIPIADGGEGTTEALVQATNGRYHKTVVTGPLGNPIEGRYGILGDGNTAVIEVAAACGLPLLTKEERKPLYATSFGVGELILDAIDKGCEEFIIGLGGSATTDSGLGMLQSLGCKFYNHQGNVLTGHGGAQLSKIVKLDQSSIPPKVKNCKFRIACDVTNPLYGSNGAAHVFSPQKGATNEEVKLLDKGLQHFANVTKEQLNVDLQSIPGSGAAGGIGAAFAGFLNAELVPGVELVLKTVKFEEKLNKIDLVITGEGKLDRQSSMGKAPTGVAIIAKQYQIPVIGFSGDISQADASLHDNGIDAFFSIVSGPTSLEDAMDPITTRHNLRRIAEQVGRLLRIFQ